MEKATAPPSVARFMQDADGNTRQQKPMSLSDVARDASTPDRRQEDIIDMGARQNLPQQSRLPQTPANRNSPVAIPPPAVGQPSQNVAANSILQALTARTAKSSSVSQQRSN